MGLSMDGFRNAVAAKLGTSSSTSTELYRIRKAWKDEASQIGAYESLENAKKNCPPDILCIIPLAKWSTLLRQKARKHLTYLVCLKRQPLRK